MSITVKNVGLCNIRVNVSGKRFLIVCGGDPVELPDEAAKLDFVKGLIEKGSLVKIKTSKSVKTPKTTEEDAADEA